MKATLTKEDLMKIELPLSDETYQMLKSREKEWRQSPPDPDLRNLLIAYLDKKEDEKLNDPNFQGGYGDL